MSVPDVSLVVCTRDRCARLGATLTSVARAAEGASVELVVVDNGSRDGTAALLARWRGEQAFPVHLVEEPRPGLARARNAGIARARGRIVALTDDDCVLHRDYFAAVIRCFAELPGPAIVGGRILLGDAADLPVTVKLEDHAMVACPRGFPGGFVMGANLAFTADVAATVGPFDERFGAGARFLAAEDTDFLFRAMGAGIPVRYDPRPTVDHHHGRRDPAAIASLLAGYAHGDGALYAKHLLRDRRIARALARDIGELRRDVTAPQPHPGIRAFHLFRLRHKLAGFAAYARGAIGARRRGR